MSGNEHRIIGNSTSVQSDVTVSRPRLTNGQIAAITIGTTFVFFLTMMMAVCAGEYWKYLHGTKKRPHIRRQRQSPAARPIVRGEAGASQLPHIAENSISQDFPTSSSFKESDSSGESGHRHRHSSAIEGTNTSILYNESSIHESSIGGMDFDESLQRVNLDCVEGCDESGMKSDEDVSMVPLIMVPCDDVIETDMEILCDSVDSRII